MIVRKWEHAGLTCAIRHGFAGCPCDYERVPEGHPFHALHYDMCDVDAYGGLTFSGRLRAPRGERGPYSPDVGGRYDVAEMRDVDTSRNWTEYRTARRLFERLMAGEIDEIDRLCSRDGALRRFGDAETYARYVSDFWFRAVVTPDGGWHEIGRMGWWGISSEGQAELREWIGHFRERFVEPYLDCTATVVDCHI